MQFEDAPQLGFALQAALEELASPDWVTATSGLTTLRRAAVHHADACRPQLCALVLQAQHCNPPHRPPQSLLILSS